MQACLKQKALEASESPESKQTLSTRNCEMYTFASCMRLWHAGVVSSKTWRSVTGLRQTIARICAVGDCGAAELCCEVHHWPRGACPVLCRSFIGFTNVVVFFQNSGAPIQTPTYYTKKVPLILGNPKP